MFFKKFRLLIICLTGSFLGASSAAIAGADSGFYIGGGTGSATISSGGFDESDAAFKAFAGYNIGFIPLVDFAVEASYVDFGTANDGSTSIGFTGFNAFGLAGLSFGPIGIFAKAGTISWNRDPSGNKDSGTDPAYGLGARFALGSLAVRAEYELFDIDGTDVDMLSISAVFTF